MEIHWFIKLFKTVRIEMSEDFTEGASIKQLETLKFAHSPGDDLE